MRKIHILYTFLLVTMLTACTGNPPETATQTVAMTTVAETETEALQPESSDSEAAMQIRVQGNGHTVVFELNNSPAARSLYNQLPLTIEVENYSSNEKIFYPPNKLEIGDTPLTGGGEEGRLAYFASWGDVIMYYGSFGPYGGLYDLGTATSGSEWIRELSGEIVLEPIDNLNG